MENSVKVLKKLKIDLSYDPEITLIRVYPKECDSVTPKATVHPCLLQNYSQ
jgi:hypothetical protein